MSLEASSLLGSSADEPEIDEIETLSYSMLPNTPENQHRAIVAEARRLRARLLSIPFYADKERRNGPGCWIQLAMSYGGEE